MSSHTRTIRLRRIFFASAVLASLLSLAAFAFVIVGGYVAIFQHRDEWGGAAVFSVLPTFVFGVIGACSWAAYDDLSRQS
jgi:hypothetical protein